MNNNATKRSLDLQILQTLVNYQNQTKYLK